jgi:hypothetical protein
MKAGVVADNYKVPLFEKELTAAGFAFTKMPYNADNTLLQVEFEKNEQLPKIHEICRKVERSARSRN